MIWVLLWLLLLPPSLPRAAIDIDIDLWADAPRCGRPEWSSITCTLCFSGRWFTRDLKRRETGRRDCLGLLKDKNRLQTCAYIIIYILYIYIHCIYIYILYIYTYIYVYIYIYLSLSLRVSLGFSAVVVYRYALYTSYVWIHTVHTCTIMYIIYICIYIYVYSTHVGTQPQEMLATCFATYGIGE